ncbi:MAG TPA: NADH-quinone oxidoreductase subunit M, partial [Acidimicrobiales bacterium]|nr:NADH-quinone oxidoreductase subunit M [Acidimicrobiales bacterium]
MNGFDHWALSAAIFVPAIGALIIGFLPRAEEQAHKLVALLTTLATLGVGIYLVARFDYDKSTNIFNQGADPAKALQFAVNRSWIDVINSRFHVGIDGISLPLLLLSMLITVLCVVYSWDHFPEPHNPKAFLILMLILEVGMNGTFVAQDLILFFVFFELVLLPMYFMIGVWGGPNRRYASIKFFLFTLFGSALMILSFLALYFKGGSTFDIPSLITNIQNHPLAHSTELLIFGGLFMGFAIKVPMFPFHPWLPDAHTEAPTAVSVLLAGVLLKMGAYGLIRICLGFAPHGATEFAPVLGIIAAINVLWGAGASMVQKDMKKMIAYSSVSHMGYVLLGVAAASAAGSLSLNYRQAALTGATLQMFTHGTITGMLFFAVGVLYDKAHTREIDVFGGIGKRMPTLLLLFSIACFASLGLPGLSGF